MIGKYKFLPGSTQHNSESITTTPKKKSTQNIFCLQPSLIQDILLSFYMPGIRMLFVTDHNCVWLAIIALHYLQHSPRWLFRTHSSPISVYGLGMRVATLVPEEHVKHETVLRQLMYFILYSWSYQFGDEQTHGSCQTQHD